jgi:tripartite-type tricarboxylate transporter receptor subunit TctC
VERKRHPANAGHLLSSLDLHAALWTPACNFFMILSSRWERLQLPFANAMELARRNFLHLLAGAVALPGAARRACAQAYPSHPVRLLVGFAAGSTSDTLARLIGQWLAQRLGQQFIVENRPGAASNLATEAAAKAPADGYTLLMVAPTAAINATLYERLAFNFLQDMAPVAGVVRVPNVLEVNPALPVKTVPELIELAKARPGTLSFASAGAGTASHLAGEMFRTRTGIDILHVPYHGDGPAMTDLVGGQVQVGFATMTASIGHIRSGRLRALAVTTATRSQVLPDLPTVADFVPGYEASSWFGVAAPKDTPVAIVERLNAEINAALADPTISARLADMSGMALAGSPAAFAALIADETDKWGKVIRAAHIKVQ